VSGAVTPVKPQVVARVDASDVYVPVAVEVAVRDVLEPIPWPTGGLHRLAATCHQMISPVATVQPHVIMGVDTGNVGQTVTVEVNRASRRRA
jgi:hypothetical protein